MASLSKTKINDNSFQSTETDVEINIFDAEKYFNEELIDIKSQAEKMKPDQRLQPLPAEFGRERAATSSEASWNSQSALLSKTAAARHRASKTWSAAKKWFVRRRKCWCRDGKSIRVKEVIVSDSDHIRPIVLMDSVNRNSKTLHADGYKHDDVVEIHRIRAAAEAPGHQRILATGRPFINATVGFTLPILNSAKDDDVGSDASSDLFEIETFSTQTASSCPIDCLHDSTDGNSNGERKLTPVNGAHRSRLSVSASKCPPSATSGEELEESVVALRPPPEEEGGGEGRRESDGRATSMSCRPEAEGPPLIPLDVCGRPLQAEKRRQGRSRSPPLVAAGG